MKRSHEEAFFHGRLETLDAQKSGVEHTGIERPLTDGPNGDEPQSSHGESNLCVGCKGIDLQKIFTSPSRDLGHGGLAVTVHRKEIDSACSLCALVVAIDSATPLENNEHDVAREGYHLRAFDSLKILRLHRSLRFASRLDSNPSVLLAVVPGSPRQGDRYRLSYRQLNTAINKGLIAPTRSLGASGGLSNGDFDYFGRKVRPSKVDYTLIRCWLQECIKSKNRSHCPCHSSLNRIFFQTRVIDCFTREIVPLIKGKAYLALSYVWGAQSKLDQSTFPNFVPSPAPATIEDAIQVVKGLGQRYLWVDRYCVSQSASKHLQIQNMGLVYEQALATILAVTGTDSESGLPGISLARRTQPFVQLEMGTLVSTLCHLSHHTGRSKWITRGWTYQEAFLSRRCLFFTLDQVFFACRSATRSESVIQSSVVQSDPSREALDISLMKVEEQVNYKISDKVRPRFSDHVYEYTTRSLSFETDGLNTF